ncbi:MAG: ABC transporter substrate-binding protein [Janthinobacterium lividum]
MKRHALTALALSALLPLAACGGGSSGSGSASASGGTTDQLTWSMWIAGQEDQAAWQKVADAASQGGAKVTIQGAPFTDYWTKLRTQLSGGSAPCIVTIQSLRAANYSDVLLPLDDLAAKAGTKLDEFDPTALEGMKVDGKLYALPYDTGPVVMLYNKDLFDEAGVPEPRPGWTAAEFEADGEKLKAKNKELFATSVEDLFLESQILAYNGGRVIKADGTLDATDAAFAQGLDWDASLVSKGYATQASADGSADDNAFVNGKVATYVDGPWSLLGTKAKAKFHLGVTSLPAGSTPTTFSAGSGFGVSKKCQYPDQAFAAI